MEGGTPPLPRPKSNQTLGPFLDVLLAPVGMRSGSVVPAPTHTRHPIWAAAQATEMLCVSLPRLPLSSPLQPWQQSPVRLADGDCFPIREPGGAALAQSRGCLLLLPD